MVARALGRVLVALVAVASIATLAQDRDAELKRLLVGKWAEVRVFEGITDEQIIHLEASGTFTVAGVRRDAQSRMAFLFSGVWDVRDGKFWYKTLTSNPEGFFPVGEAYSDQILNVTADEWIMVEQSTGQESRGTRIHARPPDKGV